MSRVCELCEKGYIKGSQVVRLIGNRVARRSITRQYPNLRSKKLTIAGTPIRVKICSSCLKKLRGVAAEVEAAAVVSSAKA